MAYDARGRLLSVIRRAAVASPTDLLTRTTLPDGAYLDYEYAAAHRLTAVANPFVRYAYGIPGYRYTLNGIIDEKGNQFASFGYDSLGRAASSEHADGVDRATAA